MQMPLEQLADLETKLGARAICQFAAYTKNAKDRREKVENLRIYGAVLLHKMLTKQSTMHLKAAEHGLVPALLAILAEAIAHGSSDADDVFQLSLRMIYTLASSPEQAVQQSLLDARCMAAVAPLRKWKDTTTPALADAILAQLLAAHKGTHKQKRAEPV